MSSNEQVQHPTHYNQSVIECIDALEASATREEFLGWCKLTAQTYLWRLGHKDDPAIEIGKAQFYLNRMALRMGESEQQTKERLVRLTAAKLHGPDIHLISRELVESMAVQLRDHNRYEEAVRLIRQDDETTMEAVERAVRVVRGVA